MTWLDALILIVFAISALVGILRGLVKEAISLATWVLAIWIALRFSAPLSELLPEGLSEVTFTLGELEFRIENLGVGIAMVVLFVLTLIVGAVASFLLSYLVKMVRLTGVDRVLGGFFGVARGGVLVLGMVLLAGLTTVPTNDIWENSLLVKPFENGADWVLGILPAHIAQHFSYP